MTISYGSILRRALTVGALAAIALAAYTYLVVEPVVDRAIAFEETMSAADEPTAATADDGHEHEHQADEASVDEGHSHGDETLFTRPEQVRGGMAATAIYALVAAGVFGTVFAAVRHRLPGLDDLGRSIWLAAMGFGALALVPAIKYPANPPAVGDPDTVGERTAQYLAMLVIGLLLMWALTRLNNRLRDRLDRGTRVVAMTTATVVVFGLALLLLPDSPDRIDPAVPAALVWDFRIRSLGALALLWTMLGVGIGWLVERDGALARTSEPDQAIAT